MPRRCHSRRCELRKDRCSLRLRRFLGNCVGPRGRDPPVGYSAHMPKQPTVKDINPIDKVGTMIAMRFIGRNDEIFIGRISG